MYTYGASSTASADAGRSICDHASQHLSGKKGGHDTIRTVQGPVNAKHCRPSLHEGAATYESTFAQTYSKIVIQDERQMEDGDFAKSSSSLVRGGAPQQAPLSHN